MIVILLSNWGTNFENQWYLNSTKGVGIEKMWRESTEPIKVPVIAMIDTGIEFNEYSSQFKWINDEELDNGVDDDNNGYIDDYYGWNFFYNTNDVSAYCETVNENSHGTFMTNIIIGNRYFGCYGIVKNDVKIMSLGVLGTNNDFTNSGSNSSIVKAIKYASNNGADICNMSLNYTQLSSEVLDEMSASKMLFVVAAGNNDLKGKLIELKNGELDNVIIVTGITKEKDLVNFCNYGAEAVTLGAPGNNIYSLSVGNKPTYQSGSSCAVPIVTGIAAEIYSMYPYMSSTQCKELLCDSAKIIDELKPYIIGGKVIDAGSALELAKKSS